MTPRRSTYETPYSMTYGTEAVIPVEISMSSMRVSSFSLDSNDELMMEQLDLLEKRQEMAYYSTGKLLTEDGPKV